jgi:hypothetical protein
VLTVVALAVSACAGTDADPSTRTAASTSPGTDDLAPGWDEPDADLDAAQLAEILRLPASAPGGPESCAPDDVALSLTFTDAALGHRFGVLAVENASAEACSVEGYPGLGARGAWGATFLLDVEHRDPLEPARSSEAVTLAAGGRARANVEWTGELAGAASEPVSLLVVQLADGQGAVGHPVALDGPSGEPDTGIDIGMLTTVRVGPFYAAPDGADAPAGG